MSKYKYQEEDRFLQTDECYSPSSNISALKNKYVTRVLATCPSTKALLVFKKLTPLFKADQVIQCICNYLPIIDCISLKNVSNALDHFINLHKLPLYSNVHSKLTNKNRIALWRQLTKDSLSHPNYYSCLLYTSPSPRDS